MPRQRSSGRPAAAPSRPTLPARAAPAPTQQQARPATTYAPAQAPPAAAAAPVASQGPGLFGQMASTAAGVAVGSTIGHAVSGLFSGGGSSAQAEAAAPQQVSAAAAQGQGQNQFSSNCAGAAESFTKCMDDNNGNMQICNWYLEQLKACQQAAKQY